MNLLHDTCIWAYHPGYATGVQPEDAIALTIDPDAIAALSPYITEHIDRFGRYSLEEGQPPPLDESIFSTAWLPGTNRDGRAVEHTRPRDHEQAAGPVQLSFDGW